MKILIVNTYHYIRGGDCRLAFDMADLLGESGHEVHFFSMQGDQNRPSPDERYFVSHIDYREANKSKNPLSALKVIWRSIYSTEARKKIALLLDEIKPDIVHLHSIRHHLTKSILPEFGRRRIPVVWTLHDYKEICPNTSFYDGENICEACKGGKLSNVMQKRCKKGSLPASVLAYLEARISGLLGYDKHVDLYMSPSGFLRDKFIEFGYDEDRLLQLPNFLDADGLEPHYPFEDYLLYIGRLEKEKGIETLIRAIGQSKRLGSTRLVVAGTGSIEDELKDLAGRSNLPNIEFVGYVQGDALEELTRKAMAIVMPSEWYENYPYSGLEAMAYGKPIIASRIGGIPEQVEDGITGFLFEPFNSADLAGAIDRLCGLPADEVMAMGRKARAKMEKNNNKTDYLSQLVAIYDRLIQDKKGWNGG